ncbi:DHH family phosphoesterase [Undibacterium sp. RuRC25W]|uniref:DHH family phosphoesterase n=1 Tax=Undibacterium sp. RuRC25W TaxID=3413047 RepID=UPI003BEF8CE2
MDSVSGNQHKYFDIFNGDADGICALHQLRMAFPREAIEVTGVKRDITLLEKIQTSPGDRLTVLDISLDANVAALKGHLDAGAFVSYFDHHEARSIFQHPHLEFHWSDAKDVCTSILVSRFLDHRYVMWAIVAAFGDNLTNVANGMCMEQGLGWSDRAVLQELGKLLNYNAYGEQLSDLHLHPADLYREVHRFVNPFDFIRSSSHFLALQFAYAEEVTYLNNLRPVETRYKSKVYVLPDAPWSRRISGLLANKLVDEQRDSSFAVLTPKSTGGYLVSIRSAQPDTKPASEFCSGFPSGGGRRLAAGINYLDEKDVASFIQRFFDFFEVASSQ